MERRETEMEMEKKVMVRNEREKREG